MTDDIVLLGELADICKLAPHERVAVGLSYEVAGLDKWLEKRHLGHMHTEFLGFCKDNMLVVQKVQDLENSQVLLEEAAEKFQLGGSDRVELGLPFTVRFFEVCFMFFLFKVSGRKV